MKWKQPTCPHAVLVYSIPAHSMTQPVDSLTSFVPQDFEPYIVVQRKKLPAYDERLRGYFENKAVHCRHLATLGYVRQHSAFSWWKLSIWQVALAVDDPSQRKHALAPAG